MQTRLFVRNRKNSVHANTGYSSAYTRIAYAQTRALRPYAEEQRIRKHGLFVRIYKNSRLAKTGSSSAYARTA